VDDGWSSVEAEAATPLSPPRGRVRGVPARIGTGDEAVSQRRVRAAATGDGGGGVAGRSLISFPSHPTVYDYYYSCCGVQEGSQLVWRPEQLSLSRTERLACSGTNQPDPEFPVGGAASSATHHSFP